MPCICMQLAVALLIIVLTLSSVFSSDLGSVTADDNYDAHWGDWRASNGVGIVEDSALADVFG